MDHAPEPAPAPAVAAAPAHPAPRMSGRGFDPASAFGPLLDFRFTKFITVNIVQVLYIVGIVLIALYTLSAVIMMFQVAGPMGGIAALIFLAPIVFGVSVLLLRVYLELIVVLFRIAENTRTIAQAAERTR